MKLKMRQHGNALFLILIAIALFAALSYALTQSSRGGSGSIEREKDVLLAAQIAQNTGILRAAVTRMRVTGGLAPAAIRLHSSAPTSDEPCTETDGTCLFTSEGGGATWPVIPREAYDPVVMEEIGPPPIAFSEIGTDTSMGNYAFTGVGSAARDGVLILTGLRKGVCEAIDRGLGIEGIPAPDPEAVMTEPDWTMDLDGKSEGCIYWMGVLYAYMAVIVEN